MNRGRPREISDRVLQDIYTLRNHYGYGSLRIGKQLGISRETARYYVNKGKQDMTRPKLVILSYNKHHLMRAAVESALASSIVPEIMVVDNTGSAESLPYISDLLYPRFTVHSIPMSENLGTSGAWNFAMKHYEHEPFVILMNDDVELRQNTLEELIKASQTSNAALVHGNATSGVTFNLCLLKTAAYQRVGPFDQTFRPIYFEDDDYVHRLQLAGYELLEVDSAEYSHVGTAHLKDIPDAETQRHHIRFRWNDAYYTAKWGRKSGASRTPGFELYTTPFNTGIESSEWHKNRARKGWILPDKYTISVQEFIRREGYNERKIA